MKTLSEHPFLIGQILDRAKTRDAQRAARLERRNARAARLQRVCDVASAIGLILIVAICLAAAGWIIASFLLP